MVLIKRESRDIAIKVPVLDAEGNETGEMIETGETRKGVAKENLFHKWHFTRIKKRFLILPTYEILVQHYPKNDTGLLSGLYGQKDRQMD